MNSADWPSGTLAEGGETLTLMLLEIVTGALAACAGVVWPVARTETGLLEGILPGAV
ncbi:MAG: hypothetical protein ACRD50_12450 [Candidatus Acidiferrales bacterium]